MDPHTAISVIKINSKAILPSYKTEGASGLDISACLDEDVFLEPFERKIIQSGIAVSIPDGYEAQIRPRSGLAINNGITVLNSPGTIDSDYRGEIGIILINLSKDIQKISHGDRIAQMVIAPVARVVLRVDSELSHTSRGKQGFGHTGIK